MAAPDEHSQRWKTALILLGIIALVGLIDNALLTWLFLGTVYALAIPEAMRLFRTAEESLYLYAGGLWLLAWILGKLLRKETMGGADVIVAGTMAALLGLPGFFVALFLSAILAILPSLLARDTMIPFVPFLSLGTLIVYLLDRPIHQLLERLIYG